MKNYILVMSLLTSTLYCAESSQYPPAQYPPAQYPQYQQSYSGQPIYQHPPQQQQALFPQYAFLITNGELSSHPFPPEEEIPALLEDAKNIIRENNEVWKKAEASSYVVSDPKNMNLIALQLYSFRFRGHTTLFKTYINFFLDKFPIGIATPIGCMKAGTERGNLTGVTLQAHQPRLVWHKNTERAAMTVGALGAAYVGWKLFSK